MTYCEALREGGSVYTVGIGPMTTLDKVILTGGIAVMVITVYIILKGGNMRRRYDICTDL